MTTMAVMEGKHSELMSGLWTMAVYQLNILMDTIYRRWVGGWGSCTLCNYSLCFMVSSAVHFH